MLSGEPDSPSCIQHPHTSVTPAHSTSGVGWTFTDISVTDAKGEKKGIRGEDDDLDAQLQADANDNNNHHVLKQ